MFTVRKHQYLFLYVNLIDIVHIYDEPLANTHELFGILTQLCSQRFFCMGQIHRNTNLLFVGSNYISIVPVPLKIDNFLNIQSDKFIARVEIDPLLRHWFSKTMQLATFVAVLVSGIAYTRKTWSQFCACFRTLSQSVKPKAFRKRLCMYVSRPPVITQRCIADHRSSVPKGLSAFRKDTAKIHNFLLIQT